MESYILRIAFITFEYPPFVLGGAGVYAKNITREITKLGHNVVVFTPKIGDEIEKKIFTKIMNINSKIKDYYIKDDNSELIKTEIGKIYYRSAGGRYFKLFTNFSTLSAVYTYIYKL